jgi:hypothetical protein
VARAQEDEVLEVANTPEPNVPASPEPDSPKSTSPEAPRAEPTCSAPENELDPPPSEVEEAATGTVHEGSSPPPPAGVARREEDKGWIAGLAIWVLILSFVGYSVWHTSRGVLLLNVTSTDPFHVSGAVTFEGRLVKGGTVQLTLTDAQGPIYVSSDILLVSPEGRFTTDPSNPLAKGVPDDRKLQLEARYFGETPAAEAKDKKPVLAAETLYIHYTPLFGPGAPWILGFLAVLFILLIFLFTGPLSKAKARGLFMFTYAVTLVACSIPIALTFWVARNSHICDIMKNAPVGLVKAFAKGTDDPQWLLNIGGMVEPRRKPLLADAGKGAGGAGPEPGGSAPVSGIGQEPAYPEVRGGLAIPLFVILLAMLGAGINMTRKVPEIQKVYDCVGFTFADAVRAPATMFNSPPQPSVPPADYAGMRKDLIETYMYFLSAPFLAIAVYYLLQMIATSLQEPVLVVVAFATGLMSNTVIGTIIAFADDWLSRAKKTDGGGEDTGSTKDADGVRDAPATAEA